MCGIAGIASADCPRDLRARAERMAELQFHRGPDDGGVMLFETPDAPLAVALASRRLAILDLSPAGHQPMCNEDGSVWVVFNGEIYNFVPLRRELEAAGHRFRSRTDTEVLVHGYEQWGLAGLVRRIAGMFAFAIWDQNRRRLSLARDRLGKKPLYYLFDGKSLAFASELKALCGSDLVDRRLSPAAAVAYLTFGAVPAPLTIFEGVKALPPAHTLVLENGELKTERYWSLRFTEDARIGEHEAAQETLRLMREAVGSRLVGDVPVGVFLSGGADSSAIVALAREAAAGPLKTYSMVFSEGGPSEGHFAEMIARKFETEHTVGVATAAQLSADLARVVAAMDQPTIDGVNTYFVSKLARDNGAVVALSGIGGDELFGGYSTFRAAPRLVAMARMLGPLQGTGAFLSRAVQGIRGGWSMDRLAEFLAGPRSIEAAYLAVRGIFATGAIAKVLDPDFAQAGFRNFDAVGYLSSCAPDRAIEPQNMVSALELRTYLHNQLLRDTDVMSMAHSLEVRAPLLDHRLAEFVASVPASIKFGGQPKGLMLRALGARLPSEVTTRAKQGFCFPFDHWLRGEFRAQAEEIIRSRDRTGILNARAVDNLWERFLDGRAHWSRIWAVMMLQMWTASLRQPASASVGNSQSIASLDSPRLPASAAGAAQQAGALNGINGTARAVRQGLNVTSGKKGNLVLGVFSQLTGPGGIPYAGRQAGAVLASFARERGMKCRILGLNDPARAEAIALGDIAFPVTGFEGSKTRLAKEVLSAALGVRLAYFGHCGLAPLGLALTMRPGAGYLVAGHGIEVWRRLPMLEGLAFRNARAISAPSRYTANQIQRHNGIPAERLFVVPWGLDPGFEARTGGNGRRPPLPAGRLLLTVSRLDATERYKGVESVLRAMPELLRKIPDVSYVVVGEGDDRPRLEAIARAAGVFEHVHFTGRMSDDEVAFYHAAADVYVMPSRKEGLGLVFLEAMACGKPVVAAAEAAAPEVVIDGETGFLVGYDDVEALSDRLGILLSDAELRARMGEAGRRRFEQNYTFARFQRRLADLLSAELIDSPRPRSFTGND